MLAGKTILQQVGEGGTPLKCMSVEHLPLPQQQPIQEQQQKLDNVPGAYKEQRRECEHSDVSKAAQVVKGHRGP